MGTGIKVDEKKFKASNRPASCTQPPWASLLPAEQREDLLRKIRQETIEAYGFSMDECPKRKVCFTKTCLGRTLPWKSETAKPYLEMMRQQQTFNKDNELVLSNCTLCPLMQTCKSACAQVNDFLTRDKSKEPELIYKDTLDNITPQNIDDNINRIIGSDIKVPWDALNKTRREIIKKYLYDQKDFLAIAKDLKLGDGSRVRYEFYAGLTILSEYGSFRSFLQKNGDSLTKKQRDILLMIYVANLNIVQAAKVLEISKQAVQQIISRTVEKYNIKWNVFVKKEGKKVIFSVPEILK